jgi:hypothetical protein
MSKIRAATLALLVLAVGAIAACGGQPGPGCAVVTAGQEVTVAGHSIKMVVTSVDKPDVQVVIGSGDNPLWIHKVYTTEGMSDRSSKVETPTTLDLPSVPHLESGGRGRPDRQKALAVTAIEFCDHQP